MTTRHIEPLKARKEERQAEVTLKFDFTKMTNEQKLAFFKAEESLLKAGIIFDTGAELDGEMRERDWEFDYSLQGPVKVIFKKFKESNDIYLNKYKCECGHKWAETWYCAVDTDCSECGIRCIEPFNSELVII